jgi:hypothetical protein
MLGSVADAPENEFRYSGANIGNAAVGGLQGLRAGRENVGVFLPLSSEIFPDRTNCNVKH